MSSESDIKIPTHRLPDLVHKDETDITNREENVITKDTEVEIIAEGVKKDIGYLHVPVSFPNK